MCPNLTNLLRIDSQTQNFGTKALFLLFVLEAWLHLLKKNQINITLSNLQLPTLGREGQSSEAVWQFFFFFFLGGWGGRGEEKYHITNNSRSSYT